MEYGESFSGAGRDTFHEDRATLDPARAHISNFLHPVLYFYRQPVKGKASKILCQRHRWPDMQLHISGLHLLSSYILYTYDDNMCSPLTCSRISGYCGCGQRMHASNINIKAMVHRSAFGSDNLYLSSSFLQH